MNKHLAEIQQRLSLRPPQSESLQKLAHAIELAPGLLRTQPQLELLLESLQAEPGFETLSDFERDFPSLCFALATGVGKTRLMGAFIAYLYRAHGIRNFFIVAPNLTIYNKLIDDFTPGKPKYVFMGLGELSNHPPLLVTGENYERGDQRQVNVDYWSITLNIFNIAKINSEVRGGKSPRIKRLSEYIGQSYFDYLAGLPDLVLLMDESHRYRASAGVRALNELRPLIGLELTATPFVEAKPPIPFKNVVYDYPLARAIQDGFVKSPAVVTQRDFDPSRYRPEELEKVKLEDGLYLHERTKAELLTYARQSGQRIVKPFVLVIARDTSHAAALMKLIESESFFKGFYRDKVIQVDSSKTGKDEDEMVRRLLAIESNQEATEIVIHVNMLKEGWDVTNLYTIIPLRAANARTLIEQTMGRGLRLPYGKRTGVKAVDWLNIVAHDRFQEIIDEANREGSQLKLERLIIEPESRTERKRSISIRANMDRYLSDPEQTDGKEFEASGAEQAEPVLASDAGARPQAGEAQSQEAVQLFTSSRERVIARAVFQQIRSFERMPELAPTSQALTAPAMLALIESRVTAALTPTQGELFPDEQPIVRKVLEQTLELYQRNHIDIPTITVLPCGDIRTGFHAFHLDLGQLHFLPGTRELLIRNLVSDQQVQIKSGKGIRLKRLEDYLVTPLVDFNDIDYLTQSELLYDLAGQVVNHLAVNHGEDELHLILDREGRKIAAWIREQMLPHFWEEAERYEVVISRGFVALRELQVTVDEDAKVLDLRVTSKKVGETRAQVYGNFQRCLYPLAKFDSDAERRFAIALEREAQKWFKPALKQFQIYYRHKGEQPLYVPDFVAELEEEKWLIEIKRSDQMEDAIVQAKSKAASSWCEHATEASKKHGGKPWRYLLIPHNEVQESRMLEDYRRFWIKKESFEKTL